MASAEEGSAAKRQAAGGAPTPTAAEGLVAPVFCKVEAGQDVGGAVAESGIAASKFISIHCNSAPKRSLITLPASKSDDDSDADETGGTAASMVHAEVSKRNQNMMTKYKVKASKSTGPNESGIGFVHRGESCGRDFHSSQRHLV